MAIKIPALGSIYIESCRRHGVAPRTEFLSALFKADVKKSRHELCVLEILLDHVKDVDFHPLLEVTTRIGDSEIEAVDVLNESSCALNGEYALVLIRSIDQKLRIVDLQDLSFGKDFLRDVSQRGLQCQVLNLRSSHFRKLNLVGEFLRLHTLNLDYSSMLSSFREDCFSSMPNLMCLSMCETRISNLWTTIAALSKLPSLVELRFQNWICCNDVGSSGSSGGDDQTGPSQPSNASHLEMPPISLNLLIDLDVMTEQAIRNLLPFSMNQNFQNANEDSLDDSEVDFSIHLENDQLDSSHSAPPGWNREINLPSEATSAALSNQNGEESSEGAISGHVADVSFKYISEHASPICFEQHYREFMIASIPQLRVLDNLPIRNIDREMANLTFFKHFERLPYRRSDKESVVSILQKREIRAIPSSFRTQKQMPMDPVGKSQHSYARSLCAAKMGSSAWAYMHSLSISGNDLGDENGSFRPRQFEYHPTNSSLMVFGTLDGEVVVVNHEKQKIVSYIPSFGTMNSVLGLCWLKHFPSRLIAGSDNGSLKLYDFQHFPSTSNGLHTASSVTFDEFDQLTSVHVNSTDELFLASGYSKNVALYDINSGRRLQVFTDMHQEHINVVKFSNRSPSIFATSSFDQDIKMWDLRQKPIRPCYTATSSKGNVMVCFSPDDHYLLASAVDNEVKQLLAADGSLHLDFQIPATGSSQNYTRSYYLNGKDYIISGSCDEHVVRVCCAQTGRRLRDISLEGKASGSSMFVQSLRGDPFRPFNMSILAAYTRPSSKSEIVKVNLLASSECNKESSSGGSSFPFNSMGG